MDESVPDSQPRARSASVVRIHPQVAGASETVIPVGSPPFKATVNPSQPIVANVKVGEKTDTLSLPMVVGS